jgi:hypothetical protein
MKIWKKEEIKMKFSFDEALQLEKELGKLDIDDDSILMELLERLQNIT